MRYGSRQFGRTGEFIEIPDEARPKKEYVHYGDFRNGYDSSDASQDTPETASPYMRDIEVTVHDSLRRCPGVAPSEVLNRVPFPQLILHASLSNRTEMLLMAPPYLGIKTTGSVQWTDLGLPGGTRYTHTNFGGTLIFSSGQEKVLVRQAESTTVEELVGGPVARSYATFAGRVWAGGATIDGTYEPLGLSWSAANSNYEDWVGLGAGFELLIANVMTGDRIVALRPMGLDFMAIVCRRSIWIGRRTGLRDRPADLQPRVPGVGAINEATVVVTRFGVIFLSDSGVFLFDGNNAELISKNINRDLLPLDFSQVEKYSASYNPFTKKYILHTPSDTWVYDLDYNRWYRRSLLARASSVFAEQFDALTWGELTGSWGEQNNIWAAYSPEEGNEFSQLFLAETPTGWQLGTESSLVSSNFASPLQPVWETKIDQAQMLTSMMLIDDIMLSYKSGGNVIVSLPDIEGQFEQVRRIILPVSAAVRTARSRIIHSGRGIGLKIEILDGDTELTRMSLGYMAESPRLEVPPAEAAI